MTGELRDYSFRKRNKWHPSLASFTHPLIHSFTHSCTHAFMHSRTRALRSLSDANLGIDKEGECGQTLGDDVWQRRGDQGSALGARR